MAPPDLMSVDASMMVIPSICVFTPTSQSAALNEDPVEKLRQMKPQSLILRVDDNHCKFRDFTYLRSAASCTEESFSHNCATGTQVLLPLFPPAFIFQLTLVVSQLPPLPTPSVHSPLLKTKTSPTHFRPRPWLAESPLRPFGFSSFCLSQQSC